MRRPRMTGRNLRLVLFAAMGLLVAVSIISADTASNSVPPTRLGRVDRAIGPNDLKPAACAALTLTRLLVASVGVSSGNNSAELIVGIPATTRINGNGGDDCIVGNQGITQIFGNGGTDVCIGWAATTFNTCETIIRR